MSRFFKDLVLFSEKTRVLIGYAHVQLLFQFQFPGAEPIGKKLGVMEDLDIALRVVVFKGIVTVRRDSNNPFYSRFLKEGQIVFRQFLEECLLTHPSDLVSAAGLFLSQDTEVETNFLKDLHKGFRYILSPGIVGWGATHIEQSIGFFFSDDLYGQVFCPVHASVTEPSPWVSVKEGIFKGISYGRRDIPLACQDISDTHDHFNVLDPCRATKGAGTAGRARPEFGPFQDLRQIGLEVGFPHKPSHVQGRPEFERTSTRARPALDAEIQVKVLNECLRINLHLLLSKKMLKPEA